MKTLLILGAGTAGTMMARKMVSKLDTHDWKVILVDKDEQHYYQPGFLFLPFGGIRKPMSSNQNANSSRGMWNLFFQILRQLNPKPTK